MSLKSLLRLHIITRVLSSIPNVNSPALLYGPVNASSLPYSDLLPAYGHDAGGETLLSAPLDLTVSVPAYLSIATTCPRKVPVSLYATATLARDNAKNSTTTVEKSLDINLTFLFFSFPATPKPGLYIIIKTKMAGATVSSPAARPSSTKKIRRFPLPLHKGLGF